MSFRSLIALVLAAAAVLAGAWFLLRPPEVVVVLPQRGPAVQAVYATGNVEPVVSAQIGPKVAGRLVEILVGEGRDVAAGQILARLDDAQARARVAELEARARYRAEEARRAQQLFGRGHISAQARDLAVSEKEAAEAALVVARQELRDLDLVAPFRGTVLRREGHIGNLVTPGQTLFWLGCCDDMRIDAAVDEEDIPLVEVGQTALVRADAFAGRVIEGRVSDITPQGDPRLRTYRVYVGLPPEAPLPPGMTAEINIVVRRDENALLVPAAALAEGGVWVVADGAAHWREVEVGVVGPERAEIRSGLSEDQAVIAAPPAKLSEGLPVRVAGSAGATAAAREMRRP